jgi:uncharacterized protein (TIRG00374 family)
LTGTSSELSSIPQKLVVRRRAKSFWTFLIYPILILLLYFALRKAPLAEIWNAVRQLQAWQIASLITINITIYMCITLRWWIIIRAGHKTISFFPLVLVRVAVFGISYFTLGPQVGGEALQVLYLQRKYGMTYTRATSTVIMDKLLEFLANFFLLVIGLTSILETGILSTNAGKPLVGLTGVVVMVAILLWPFIHIALMVRRIYPLGVVLRAGFSRFGNPRWMRFIIATEQMAGRFCRRKPWALWSAAVASLVAGAGMITEYILITSFLGINLQIWQTIAAWTTSWLAFLVPLPGGLGSLEASQVFTLGAFGISAALAVGVTLLIRARDLLIGGLGLLFASRGVK